jgi:hypothetical protein
MDQEPAIFVDLAERLGPDRGFAAERAAHPGEAFAEPDATILAWIASHVPNTKPRRLV